MKKISVLIVLAMIVTIGGVYATWNYAQDGVDGVDVTPDDIYEYHRKTGELPKTTAAEAFSYMQTDTQEALLHLFTNREMSEVMNGLYDDDAVDLLEDGNIVMSVFYPGEGDEMVCLSLFLTHPAK